MQPMFTMVFRQAGANWLGLCLENGVVAQGATKSVARTRLDEALALLTAAIDDDPAIYQAPLSIRDLHEFLTYAANDLPAQSYEMQAVYA